MTVGAVPPQTGLQGAMPPRAWPRFIQPATGGEPCPVAAVVGDHHRQLLVVVVELDRDVGGSGVCGGGGDRFGGEDVGGEFQLAVGRECGMSMISTRRGARSVGEVAGRGRCAPGEDAPQAGSGSSTSAVSDSLCPGRATRASAGPAGPGARGAAGWPPRPGPGSGPVAGQVVHYS